MTQEVANLVLKNNYDQAQAISLISYQSYIHIELHRKYIDTLESNGLINREIEYLPSSDMIEEHKKVGKGLFTPGISTLVSYTKSILNEEVLESDLPEEEYCIKFLTKAFPVVLSEKYLTFLKKHSLRREIVSTYLSNEIINEMGIVFINRLQNETGVSSCVIVKAYLAAKHIFNIDKIKEQINQLDNIVNTDTQYDIMVQLTRLLRRATRWILRSHRKSFTILDIINEYNGKALDAIDLIVNYLKGYDLVNYNNKKTKYIDLGVPESLASFIAMTRALHATLDCIDASITFKLPLNKVIEVYFKLGDTLSLGWLRSKIIGSAVETSWDALSREALRDDLDWQQKRLVVAILTHKGKTSSIQEQIEMWQNDFELLIVRWSDLLNQMQKHSIINFTMMFVAVRELLDLTQTCSQRTLNLDTLK